MRIQKEAQICILVHCDRIDGNCVMQHIEEVGEDNIEVLFVDWVARLGHIGEEHFFQCFVHQTLDLLTWHRAKVERGEHVLCERVGMLEEHIDLLAQSIVYDQD